MAIAPERLKEAREQAGLDVMDLAVLTRIQPAYIYQLETGSRQPGAATLRKYVEAKVLTRDEAAEALLGAEDVA